MRYLFYQVFVGCKMLNRGVFVSDIYSFAGEYTLVWPLNGTAFGKGSKNGYY